MPPRFKERKGVTLVWVALLIVVIMGFAALALDVGQMYLARQHAQNAVDAGALAGGLELPNQDKAAQKAIACTNANAIYDVVTSFPTADRLRVDGKKPVNFGFARVIGFLHRDISAYAIVERLKGVSSVSGNIMPWGIQQVDYQPNQIVTLKIDNSELNNPNMDPTPGNFYALAIGGTGGANYVDNIKWGYEGTLSVGDVIETETGEVVGPTSQGVKYDPNTHDSLFEQASVPPWNDDTEYDWDYGNPRIGIVPIISAIGHGHTEVTVLGFAAFYIIDTNGKWVTGRFIEYTIPNAQPGGPDFGLCVLRLIE